MTRGQIPRLGKIYIQAKLIAQLMEKGILKMSPHLIALLPPALLVAFVTAQE